MLHGPGVQCLSWPAQALASPNPYERHLRACSTESKSGRFGPTLPNFARLRIVRGLGFASARCATSSFSRCPTPRYLSWDRAPGLYSPALISSYTGTGGATEEVARYSCPGVLGLRPWEPRFRPSRSVTRLPPLGTDLEVDGALSVCLHFINLDIDCPGSHIAHHLPRLHIPHLPPLATIPQSI